MLKTDRTAALMPLPGIGDLVWHLPCIHAIAESRPDRQVILIAKPRTGATTLLRGDRAIGSIISFDRHPVAGQAGRHDGILGYGRLINLLNRSNLRRIFIFHRSWRYTSAARLAGIPERFSYRTGPPHHRRQLRRQLLTLHAFYVARNFVESLGIAISEAEPVLPLAADAVTEVRSRFSQLPRPMIAFGIGSSEPNKHWPLARFGTLATQLLDAGWGTILLLGGPGDAAAGTLVRAAAGPAAERLVQVFDLSLDRSAALLSLTNCYFGNDTGMLNVAAAVGTRAVGLFGATEPLTHSRRIEAVTPEGGMNWDTGMDAIPVGAAFAAVGRPTAG